MGIHQQSSAQVDLIFYPHSRSCKMQKLGSEFCLFPSSTDKAKRYPLLGVPADHQADTAKSEVEDSYFCSHQLLAPQGEILVFPFLHSLRLMLLHTGRFPQHIPMFCFLHHLSAMT
jgi:hypothetical protein